MCPWRLSPDERSPSPEFDSWEWGDIQWFGRTAGAVLLLLLISYGAGTAFFGLHGFWAVLAGVVPAALGAMLLSAAVRCLGRVPDSGPLVRYRLWRLDRAAARAASRLGARDKHPRG